MKAIFVLRLVLVSALLVTMTVPTSYAPLAAATPVDNQSTSFQTPPSDVVSADSEQSLARAAIEAALAKERSHDGQARQATPVQVTVEGEWGYATLAEPQDGRTASEPVTVLARRLPSGEWQAVTPRDFEAYNQWLESVPETLLASTMKEQIRTQITPTPEVTTVEQVTAQPTATPTPSVSTSPNVELSTNIQISRTIAHTTTFYLPVILGEKWTLYSSKRFGYSIQYPPEYRVVDRQEIQPTADSSGVPSDVWFNDHIHVISRIPSLPNDLVTRLWSSAQKIILVSGFSAYRREYLSQPIEDESSERSKPVLSIEYLVRHKGADYFLIYESSTNDSYYITTQEIFEQMVNSFQVLPEYTYSPSTVEAAAAAATAFDFFVDPPNGATRSPSYASYNARNPYLTNTAPCYNKPYSQLQHTAEDWFRPASTNVYAVANGRVVWSRDENYPGAVVIIEHTLGNGWSNPWGSNLIYSVYSHLATNGLIAQWSDVTKGQLIGRVLDQSSNSHIHFEMRRYGDMSSILVCPANGRSSWPGPGYTDTGVHPDTYGYTHPSNWIDAHRSGSEPTPTPNPTPSSTPPPSGWAYQIFALGDFNGEKFESSQTYNDLTLINKNDWAESIKVNSGYEIRACTDANFQGTCGKSKGPSQFADINALAQGLRRGLSSIEVCPGSCPEPPSKPTLIYPSVNALLTTNDDITLQWSSVSNATEYAVELWGPIVRQPGHQTGTSYYVGQLPAGSYTWKVEAYNAAGWSGWVERQFTVQAPQTVPSAPSLQSPSNGATFNEGASINLTWSATGNEYYGEVWGGPAGTSTFGWQSGTAKDIGSQWAGYTYSWHIKARNSAGESGWSSTRTFTVKPAVPTNLNAQAVSRTQVNLAWADNSGNEGGYKIYRNGTFLTQVGANVVAYQDTNASCNTHYTYQVKAYRGSIESDGSNSATVTTPACEQAKPDLVPYQDASWAFPVVPASIPGTFIDNALYTNHPTYFDWGVKNQGNAAPGALFYVDLLIDNTRFIHYPFNSDPGVGIWFIDWSDPINMTGQHTLKIVVDPENAIAESNETNNIWERQFTWNPVNGWWGEYFNTLDLSGNPALVRDDAAIDFVWLGDAPGVGVNTDFSARWTRSLAFSAGTYRFSATHDDGMRLWVDNILYMDQWDTCCRTDTVDVPITAGSHDLRMEFRDTDGWATAQLTWAALSCNDNLEPNNTVSQATLIVNEQTHSGDICQAGDEDYYRFTGNAGDHIVLDINAQTNGSSLDAYLLLFDSDGTTVLAFNDDFEQLDSYLEYDLPRTGTYYAKVREYNHPNEGGPSYFYQLLFRKSSAVTVPAAPSSMSAVGVSATQINVAWADNSNNETGFRLYRSPTSTTSWTLVATLGANATSYANTATNLLCGETYRYRMRAYNSAGSSSYSNIASAQILCTTGPIFRDDFESGNLTKWSGSSNAGSMSVTQGAALVGSRGLQMAVTSNTATYLFDNTPYLEAHYRMRFYLDPNSLSMANGDLFYPFYGYSGTTPAVLRVDLRRYNGNYQVRSGLLLDSGTWQFTPFYNISDAPHSIEVDWQAATSTGANNGGLTLWIDNVLKRTLTGIDNDTRRIDQARLGAFGIDAGTRGTFYLDDFVSRRDNYIGPAAALAATAPDAVLDQIDTEAQITLPSMTAALTPGVTTTLSEELDGPTVIVVTAPTTVNAPGSAVLTAIEDDTLPDGYRRVGHAFDIGFVMVDGAPFATLTDGYTVTVAYQELDPTMSLQAWNSTLGLWEVVPTIYNAENHTVQATLQQPARLALMQVEPKEEYTEYQLHLPLIQQ